MSKTNKLQSSTLPKGDINAIHNIFDTMTSKMNQEGRTFGESMSNVSASNKESMVRSLTNTVFGKDERMARSESAISTNSGLAAINKSSLIGNLKEEFEERANNIVKGYAESTLGGAAASQAWSIYGSHMISNKQQLLLTALAPAVIKPIYNKVLKTLVTKDLSFEREIVAPYVVDEKGNTYDFYELLNSTADTLEKIGHGGQPKIRVKVPMDQKAIKEAANNSNLCTIYNREGRVTNPESFRVINKVTDFIARGVSIVSVDIEDKEYAVNYTATGNNVQSGQLNTEVATISLTLTDEANPDEPIQISGKVKANGDVYLSTSSDKVKGVTFEFIVPSKGAEAPLKVADRKSVLKHFLQRKATGSVTLNQQLIDDVNLVIDKDIVTSFTEKIVQLTNSRKDSTAINYIDKLIKDAYAEDKIGRKYVNDEAWGSRRSVFAYRSADMNVMNPGMTDFLHGGNIGLAKSMFDVCNMIDVKLNPEEKRFSIMSSSAAAQWIKDASKQDVTSLNLTGAATNNGDTIGGIATPYTLQSVQIGNLYTGKYIVTNKILSKETTRSVAQADGTIINASTASHRFTVMTDFEENMDGTIFTSGLEYVTEGVNDNEFVRDKTLNYETRFDLITYNNSIGVVDFIEAPMSSHIYK